MLQEYLRPAGISVKSLSLWERVRVRGNGSKRPIAGNRLRVSYAPVGKAKTVRSNDPL
jgi:hypothetical protein